MVPDSVLELAGLVSVRELNHGGALGFDLRH